MLGEISTLSEPCQNISSAINDLSPPVRRHTNWVWESLTAEPTHATHLLHYVPLRHVEAGSSPWAPPEQRRPAQMTFSSDSGSVRAGIQSHACAKL